MSLWAEVPPETLDASYDCGVLRLSTAKGDPRFPYRDGRFYHFEGAVGENAVRQAFGLAPACPNHTGKAPDIQPNWEVRYHTMKVSPEDDPDRLVIVAIGPVGHALRAMHERRSSVRVEIPGYVRAGDIQSTVAVKNVGNYGHPAHFFDRRHPAFVTIDAEFHATCSFRDIAVGLQQCRFCVKTRETPAVVEAMSIWDAFG